jgi:acyl dehydratase
VGAAQPEANPHVFRKHFEELEIGETVFTHKHTVTEADIVNFANVSGDNFYAHMDATSLEGTIFEGRVAHGYFILSKAAGLFVDPKKGPVLLNYGIDEARFTKPVYPGNDNRRAFYSERKSRSGKTLGRRYRKRNCEVFGRCVRPARGNGSDGYHFDHG